MIRELTDRAERSGASGRLDADTSAAGGAALAGGPTWNAYLALPGQLSSLGALVGRRFVAYGTEGGEFSDETVELVSRV